MRSALLSTLLLVSITVFGQQFSSRYELVKMDKNVNTFRHEAAPVVSPDGNTLYFFVQDHPENTMGKEDTQDIWMSKKDEAAFGDRHSTFVHHLICIVQIRSLLYLKMAVYL